MRIATILLVLVTIVCIYVAYCVLGAEADIITGILLFSALLLYSITRK